MFLLSFYMFVQLLVWAAIQLVLYVMVLEGIEIRITLPLHILWFWVMFRIHIWLNILLVEKGMKNRDWDKDGTLDPYIRKVRMYIRNVRNY